MTRRLRVPALLACALVAGGTAGSLGAASAATLEVSSAPLQVWDLTVSPSTAPPPTAPAVLPEAPPAEIAPPPFEVVIGEAPTPLAPPDVDQPEVTEPEPYADPAPMAGHGEG